MREHTCRIGGGGGCKGVGVAKRLHIDMYLYFI